MALHDDDDLEFMAGQNPEAILQTIYNGSAACSGCGALMTPTTTMYTGNICPDCSSARAAKHITTMTGR